MRLSYLIVVVFVIENELLTACNNVLCKAVDLPPWQTWTDGSWSQIAMLQAGDWLYWCIIAISVVSNFGMYVAELMEDTWQLCGMAECGLAPRFFAKKTVKYGAPVVRTMTIYIKYFMSVAEWVVVMNSCL